MRPRDSVEEKYVRSFDAPITIDGATWIALLHASNERSGSWSGAIEFRPDDGSPALMTGAETTQSSLDGVLSWASSLTLAYFEQALGRARTRAASMTAETLSAIAPPGITRTGW